MLEYFKQKRAETILEVVIALFIIAIGVTTSSVVLNRAMNVTASNQLWEQAVFFAKEGLEATRNVRDTNWMKFADEECWKTIETSDVCDSLNSPMMAEVGSGESYYSVFFDHVDFTWSLEGPILAINEFSDAAVLMRLPNEYSIHQRFLEADEGKPVFIGESFEAENTNFYRQIRIEALELDVDGDSSTDPEEVLVVTSTMKWPYRKKVNTYSVTTLLTNFRK
ncbi:hypothetical protein HOG48_03740 [Candidatus Peregrinibacteria bacterium]|jgi:hypothetical protein|nr:hypothetical protein [Candidatus Peregrinibacteria bacterium]